MSTTTVKVPCFDHLDMIRKGHYQKKEADFEMKLRSLINQLMKKLLKRKKMLKKMKKKSKKGRDEIQLTKWRIDSLSPMAGYSESTQRWMLFRASWDLWQVMTNLYGEKFSFRISANLDSKSMIKQNLYLSWRVKTKNNIYETIQLFKKPSYLSFDPRVGINANNRPATSPPSANAPTSTTRSEVSQVTRESQSMTSPRSDPMTSPRAISNAQRILNSEERRRYLMAQQREGQRLRAMSDPNRGQPPRLPGDLRAPPVPRSNSHSSFVRERYDLGTSVSHSEFGRWSSGGYDDTSSTSSSDLDEM